MQQTNTQPEQISIPRTLQFALFLIGLLLLIAARFTADHASAGISTRFALSQYPAAFLAELFFLFLVLTDFTLVQSIVTRSGGIRATNSLPTRPTASREWQLGAVIGWGLALLTIAPMMLVGDLHPTFWLTLRSILLTLLITGTLALSTLATEAAFRGFLFRRLINSVGPTLATILLSGLYAFASSFQANASPTSVLITFVFGILLSMAYLRTHALWLGWGLHFAWTVVIGIALGLPVAGNNSFSTIVDTNVSGAAFLTGGTYGPEAAPLTFVFLLLGIFVLYHSTRDYAWNYTHPVILSGGFPMDVAPPPAHAAMEKAHAPQPLVQIAVTTGTKPSTLPEIEDHLRRLDHERNETHS